MKLLGCILVILFSFSTKAQEGITFLPAPEIELGINTYTVVMLSADWCAICKSNKRALEKSSEVKKGTRGKFTFYELMENEEASINFGEKTFHYVPSGINVGRHEFLDLLLDPSESAGYPTFVILDQQGELVSKTSGFLSESDWVKICKNLVY